MDDSLRDGDLTLELESFAFNSFHGVPAYSYVMRHATTGEELGSIRLRIGNTPHIHLYAGHIGYAVHPPHRGHHYAARAVRLLIPLAHSLGIDPLWITCDPDNAASRRSLELAGAEYIETVTVPDSSPINNTEHPYKCRYRLNTLRQTS